MDYDNGSTPYLNKREFRKTKHGVEKRAERKTELVEGLVVVLLLFSEFYFVSTVLVWQGAGYFQAKMTCFAFSLLFLFWMA